MRLPTCLLATLALACVPAAVVAAAPDAAVGKQLQALGLDYEVDDDGDYRVVFETSESGDRTQLAYVRSSIENYGSLAIREIWSPGYKSGPDGFSAEVANRLLEASHEAKLGAWTRQGDYAVYVVQMPAGANEEALRDAIEIAVRSADAMEAELAPGTDEL